MVDLHSPELPTLDGYRVTELLYSGHQTLVCRGLLEHREPAAEGTAAEDFGEAVSPSVVIKFMMVERPNIRQLVNFRNQYVIARNLTFAGIVAPLELKPWGGSYALVMEDFGGVSLDQYLQEHQLSWQDVVAIAIQLTEILQALHQAHVIHKDIKPANLLIHPETQEIKLIDFSIASVLPKENQEIQSPNALEGTLAYMAPEQTGRMNRGIDYRTDFYGLGVTLYELLTGVLPFAADDALELLHCHLSRIPAAPHVANTQVPRPLSAIVLKLMAKNAEERYQTAEGLRHDLQDCWNRWETSGQLEPFELGQRDVSDRFLIPEKLYGRETEVQALLDTFERVAQGNSELMLVSGFAGIGKTALVNELHKPITRQQGYFIKGKFDQLHRNIPFFAFGQAFRQLIDQILGESDTRLAAWKDKILNVSGKSGQVLVDVIPSLVLVIGEQPTAPALSGMAAQNRFDLLIRQFIRLFATPTHPLVIFLDDLQWADSASLTVLMSLMTELQNDALLIIGAYRDNEVSESHPLMMTLNEIKHEIQSRVNCLKLNPLALNDVNHFVADSLKCDLPLAVPLANLIHQKTEGNPFFVAQFLLGLYRDTYIDFNPIEGYWQCDLSQLRQLSLTDDIVIFLLDRLQQLPEQTQEILKVASCLGSHFDLEALSLILNQTQRKIAGSLWLALQMGLIIPESEIYKFFRPDEESSVDEHLNPSERPASYRFLHDRVQQAAYCLISEDERALLHWQIGQSLLEKLTEAEVHEQLFDLVNHWNVAQDILVAAEDRRQLCQLNLKAGQKAKVSIAYDMAEEYAFTAVELLDSSSWETDYRLTLSVHELLIEVSYLNGRFEQVESWTTALTQHTSHLLDTIPAHKIKILAMVAQEQFLEAIQHGLQILASLEIAIQSDPTPQEIQQALADTATLVPSDQVQALGDLPVMTDARALAALQILNSIAVSVYLAKPQLFPLIVLAQVKLSILYGNAAVSAGAYARYSIVLCGRVGDIETGYKFGQLALTLSERFDERDISTRVLLMVGALTLPWKQHLRDAIPLLHKAYITGIESGNLEPAALSRYYESQSRYLIGNELGELERQLQAHSEHIFQANQEVHFNNNELLRQAVLNLLGREEKPCLLIGKAFNEEMMLPQYKALKNLLGLFSFYLHKLMLCYLFDEMDEAVNYASEAAQYLSGVTSQATIPVFYFYSALANLAYYSHSFSGELVSSSLGKNELRDNGGNIADHKIFDDIEQCREKIKHWSTFSSENFQHRLDLIDAERARVLGDRLAAIEAYEVAISGARQHGYLQEEALANELLAKMYLDWRREKVAAVYMQEAYYCYARWGARAKTNALEERYPNLLEAFPLRRGQFSDTLSSLHHVAPFRMSRHSAPSISSSEPRINESLDLAAILQSAQVFSESIDLDALLQNIARLVMQVSGADLLMLILSDANDHWQVRVSATLDNIQLEAIPLVQHTGLPVQLIQYVKHTQEVLVVDDLDTELPILDAYLQQNQPRSLLCLPILHRQTLTGLLYLQNKSIAGAFNHDRITAINFLCVQAAISLQNAQLYQTLEQRVEERTQALQDSQYELSDYIENAATSLHWVDTDGIIIWANQTELDFLGYSREEYIGQPIAKFHADQDVIEDILTQLSNNETLINYEARLRCKDGSIRYVQINSNVFSRDGIFVHTRCFTTDITERKTAESALNELVAGTATTLGEDFFPALVHHTSLALDVPMVVVTQFVDQELQSLSFVVDGESQPSFTCDLLETPCRELVVNDSYHCAHGVLEQFPNHPYRSKGAVSYLGVALRDRQGQALGSLCILDRKPLQNSQRAHQILTVFASRAAAELERQRAEHAMARLNRELEAGVRDRTAQLIASEQRLQTLFDQAADAVFLTGKQGFIDCNQAAVDLLRYPSKEDLLRLSPHQISPERQPDGQLSSAKAQSIIRHALQRSSPRFEWLHQRADGETFWAEITLTPIRYQEELIFHCMTRDISDRKQAEQALKDSQEQFRRMTENVPGMIYRYVLHPDGSQELNYVSSQVREIYELEPEIVLQDLSQLQSRIHPEDREQIEVICTESAETLQSFTLEHRLLLPEKGLRWIQAIAQPERLENGDIIWDGLAWDISERKAIEQQLEFTQYGLDHAADCFYCLDSEARIVQVNQATCLRTGYTKNQLLSMTMHELTPTCPKETTWQPHWEKLKRLKSYSFESVQETATGEIFPVEVVSNYLEFEGQAYDFELIRDITTRKQAEAALHLSEARATATFEQATVGFAEVDLTSHQLSRSNPCFAAMLGYTVAELTNMTVAEITHPDDVALAHGPQQRLLQGDIDSFTLEKRYRRKDGSDFWAETTVYLIRQQNGEALYEVALIQDIGQKKRLEIQRQQAVAALQLSEARASAAFEQAAVGIAESNLSDGKITRTNDYFCKLTGYSAQELKQLNAIHLTHPDDIFESREKMRQLYANEIDCFSVEKRYLRKDGSSFWASTSVSLVHNPEEELPRCLAVVQDISDRKAAEQALILKQNHLEALLDNIPHIAWIKDEVSRFIAINQPFAQASGKTTAEIIGKTDYDLWPAELAQAYRHDDFQILQSGQRKVVEERVAFADGSLGWLETTKTPFKDHQGEFAGTVGIAANISDRKNYEQKILESQTFLQTVLDTFPLSVFWKDRESRYIGVNQNFARDAGLIDPQDIVGLTDFDLPWTKAEAEAYRADDQEVMQANTPKLGIIETQVQQDGTQIWLETNKLPLHDLDGNVIGVMGTYQDISDRKLAEEKLQESNAELAQANEKMLEATRLKDEFLANMSHELRTPLNSVIGFSQLMQRDSRLPKKHQETLNIINRNGEHLLCLINDILEMSKIEAGQAKLHLKIIELPKLLEELRDNLRLKFNEKSLELDFSYDSDIPTYIWVDGVKLRQILLNLLDNAFKFTEKGQVGFSVQTLVSEQAGLDERVHLQFTVSDTGPGIPSENQEVIFNPFIQSSAGLHSYQGTGLGLPISRKFAQMMGGDISVDSVLGQGSTFCCDIFARSLASHDVVETMPQKRYEDVQGLKTVQTTYRLLVVDDNQDNQLLLSQMLSLPGLEIETASNGLEAVERNESWRPHLIWMDIRMPVMDGLTAMGRIRQSTHRPKIVAITAHVFENEHEMALEAGFDDFISKPFSAHEVFERIERLLEVEFVWVQAQVTEEEATVLVSESKSDVLLIQEGVQTMPVAWQQALRQAICSLNNEAVTVLLAEVPEEQQAMVEAISALQKNYRYDTLIDILSFDL